MAFRLTASKSLHKRKLKVKTPVKKERSVKIVLSKPPTAVLVEQISRKPQKSPRSAPPQVKKMLGFNFRIRELKFRRATFLFQMLSLDVHQDNDIISHDIRNKNVALLSYNSRILKLNPSFN